MGTFRLFILILVAAITVGVGAQTVVSTYPGTFVDISTTGTPLASISDDSCTVITTTIGNQMFPAGPVSISNNGWALSGSNTFFGYFFESDIPTTGLPTNMVQGSWGGVLMPHWDDLYPAVGTGIFWQELNGVLYIQWNNENHFADPTATPTDSITFEIQIFSNANGPLIQFLYTDTVFGGAYAANDNGASATVGYAGGANPAGNGNAKWSYDTAGAIGAGTVLSFFPKFSVTASSPGGAPGTVQVNIAQGPAGGLYFLAVTFSPGNYPAGWFYGIDISFPEIGSLLATGFPFFSTLDGTGSIQIGPVGGLPSGLTFYATTLAAVAGANYPSYFSGAWSYTIP